MGIRKLRLESDSPDEATLIGISSALKDYRMIHYLNKELRVDFAKIPDLPFSATATRVLSVPLYHYFHELTENNWLIFSNRSASNEFVFPQHKNLDFFLLIDDLINEDEVSKLVSRLRQVKDLSLAVSMDGSKVNKIDLLYADLEMHLTDVFSKENTDRGRSS